MFAYWFLINEETVALKDVNMYCAFGQYWSNHFMILTNTITNEVSRVELSNNVRLFPNRPNRLCCRGHQIAKKVIWKILYSNNKNIHIIGEYLNAKTLWGSRKINNKGKRDHKQKSSDDFRIIKNDCVNYIHVDEAWNMIFTEQLETNT